MVTDVTAGEGVLAIPIGRRFALACLALFFTLLVGLGKLARYALVALATLGFIG